MIERKKLISERLSKRREIMDKMALIFQRYNDVVLTVKDKDYVELLAQLEELSKDDKCCPFCGKDLSIFLRFARSNSSYKEELVMENVLTVITNLATMILEPLLKGS